LGVELTFYGGLREIGGTKILLRTDGGSIFLDFGQNFDLEGRFFEQPWNPPFYIPSLLQIGALPPISGLYRMLPGRPVDGVVVSHAHLDHCGWVPTLSPKIPVYAGEDTKNLILIRSETYDRGWQNDWGPTDWRTFNGGELVSIEGTDIAFTSYEVDHSVPGSFAFIVDAAGKKLAYTGDLRMHGRRRHLTNGFLRALRHNKIDVLIVEGTHVVPEGEDAEARLLRQAELHYNSKVGEDCPQRVEVPCETEEELQAKLGSIVRDSHGLVVVETPAIDLDRVYSVWRAASDNGRTLILPSRLAHIVLEAHRRTNIEHLPDIAGTALYLSQLKMRADRRGPNDPLDAEELAFGRRQWQQRSAFSWTQQGGLLFGLPQGRRAIAGSAEDFVVCTPQAASILSELSYGTPRFPITFVLSRSTPFNLPMVDYLARLHQWLVRYGCSSYYHLHVSGHGSDADLQRVIQCAAAERVIPIHTRWPEVFRQWHDRVLSGHRTGEAVAL
jgi:ribonuclease J